MDALSDLLRVIRLKGGVFLHAEFTAPWCIEAHPSPQECSSLLNGADHVILYHYVTSGRVLAQLPDREPMEFEAGQVMILPRNDRHRMGSRLDLAAVPTGEIVQVPNNGGLVTINHGGNQRLLARKILVGRADADAGDAVGARLLKNLRGPECEWLL